MKKIEITIGDNLHRKLKIASQRAARPFDKFIEEQLARLSADAVDVPVTPKTLLAEGYKMMAKENAELAKGALAAQIMAIETAGQNSNGTN